MLEIIHQYGYFFSLILFILPVSIIFDANIKFRAANALLTSKGIFFIIISILFWFLFDLLFWTNGLGSFPDNRVLFKIHKIAFEEIVLFVIGFYNIAAIFSWAKEKYS